MIVIEGPDGTGKSYLARIISNTFGMSMCSSQGPEKYPGEINERVTGYLKHPHHIYDRHSCVTHPIYSTFSNTTPIDNELMSRFYELKPLFIYCRNPMGDHVVKDHDSPEHLAMIENRKADILRMYDEWAFDHADIIYHGDVNRVLNMIMGGI